MATHWLRRTKLKLAAAAYRVYDPSVRTEVDYGPGAPGGGSGAASLAQSFQHEALGHPRVVQFAEACEKVLDGRHDPFEICDRLRGLTEHGVADRPPGMDDPHQLLRLARSGTPLTCRPFALLLGHALITRGYTARLLGMSRDGSRLGHAATEVYLPQHGQWVLIDCDFNVAYRRAGQWLGALDLQQAWSELKQQLGVDARLPPDAVLDSVKRHKGRCGELSGVEVVALGAAGESLRERNMRGGSVTGMNLEFGQYLYYAHRNDYLGSHYPPGHPAAVKQFFLAAPPGKIIPPLIPEAEQLLADQKPSINWPVGRTEVACTELPDGGTRLTLSTWAPNFSHFESRVATGPWEAIAGNQFDVPAKSRERRSFRAVNTANLAGEVVEWTMS